MNRTIIENTLIEIGMPTNIKGFKYIVDTVMLLSKPEWKDPKWTALYYCVSQLNNCTACSVEKSIRTALRITRDNCIDYNLIEHYTARIRTPLHCCILGLIKANKKIIFLN